MNRSDCSQTCPRAITDTPNGIFTVMCVRFANDAKVDELIKELTHRACGIGPGVAPSLPDKARNDDGSNRPMDLDLGAQPRCPHCGIVMRDIDHGSVCPECGYTELFVAVDMPPEFDGPSIKGG